MKISFVFINPAQNIVFNKKKKRPTLTFGVAACITGSHGKLTQFTYFPWPPFESGLSYLSVLFLIHALLMIR